LQELSLNIAALPSTGTYTFQYGTYSVKGDCTSLVQVFNIKATDLATTSKLNHSCIPTGATVIFNITGGTATLQNMGMQSLINLREKVLFNFPAASQINMISVGIEGSVLAPYAQFYNPSGSINGRLIAKSWNSTNNGWVSINNIDFSGDLSAAAGASSKNAVAQYQFGQGKTVFVGFDILAQALLSQTANPSSNTNVFAEFLARSLVYVQPDTYSARAGKAIQLHVDVWNEGPQLVDGKAKLILSNNLKMIDGSSFVLTQDNVWGASFSLQSGAHQVKTLYVQLPAITGDLASIKLLLQTGSDPNPLTHFEKTFSLKAQ